MKLEHSIALFLLILIHTTDTMNSDLLNMKQMIENFNKFGQDNKLDNLPIAIYLKHNILDDDQALTATQEEQPMTTASTIQDYQCPYTCGKAYKHLSSLYRHIATKHTFKDQHNCPYCDKEFNRSDTKKDHISLYHSHMSDKLHICRVCKKKFLRPFLLKNHIQNEHSNESSLKS